MCFFCILLGSGVFAKKVFFRGDFLLQYRGEVITGKEGERRLEHGNPNLGSFLYFYESSGRVQKWSVISVFLVNAANLDCDSQATSSVLGLLNSAPLVLNPQHYR
jgi:hypothetical protein